MKLRSILVMLVASSLMLGCASDVRPTISPTPRLTAPPTPSPTPLVPGSYFDDMISFDYPLEWNAGQFWYPSSVSILKLMASTEELRPPCVQSGSAVLCRNAVEELSPGGLFVAWWRWGLTHAAPGPDPNVGELIHVGGRSARISDAGGLGKCLNMKADVSLRVEIPDPTLNGSWTVIDACLREPIADARAAVDEMLASIEWLGPQPTQVVPLSVANNDFSLQIFDDTGLVTAAQQGSAGLGEAAVVTVDGSSLKVDWSGGTCQRQPILGLAEYAGRLLILLEPAGGQPPPGTTACNLMLVKFSVTLTLSEPVAQDDVDLEVW